MDVERKIVNLEILNEKVQKAKAQGKKIVHCLGHFNVLHPGHHRYFQFAKKQGEFIVVSVLPSELFPNHDPNSFYSQAERALNVASLNVVDAVYNLTGPVTDFIRVIKPDIHVKGREYESLEYTFADEWEAIQDTGGKLIYSSGYVRYAFQDTSTMLSDVDNTGSKLELNSKDRFLATCKKHKSNISTLIGKSKDFGKLKILVIGDTIVDQYVACDTLGVSSEAPVLAIRELSSKQFLGGAGIVAQHIKAMGAQSYFISVTGKDEPGQFAKNSLDQSGVHSELIIDEDRPTTFKIRYMVENQKILRVSRLEQHDINSIISAKIIAKVAETIPKVDGVVISDFVYGVVTDEVLLAITSIAKECNKPIFGDLQCSSQFGDVSRFKNFDLITPTEKEARIAAKDTTLGLERLAANLLRKTANKSLVITLGAQGLVAFEQNTIKGTVASEYFPAIEDHAIDVAGAGDSMLAAYVLCICSGFSLLDASIFASCVSGLSVSRLGNIPVTIKELEGYVSKKLASTSGYLY